MLIYVQPNNDSVYTFKFALNVNTVFLLTNLKKYRTPTLELFMWSVRRRF
jgi:hypothetical protein